MTVCFVLLSDEDVKKKRKILGEEATKSSLTICRGPLSQGSS